MGIVASGHVTWTIYTNLHPPFSGGSTRNLAVYILALINKSSINT